MKKTRKTAICGISAALSCVLLYVATVTELFELCGCVAAAFIIIFIYIEYGGKSAVTVYIVTALISALILPDKFPAAVYALFAGYYPVLKAKLERLHPALAWILKLICYNAVLTGLILAARYITSVEFDSPAPALAVFVLGNAVFVLSDLLASRLIFIYLRKYRPLLIKRGLL